MSNTAYAGQFRNTIIMMNPDGTNRRVVLDEPGKNLLAPVWSPAGDTIAFNFVESGGLFAGTRNNAPAHIAIAAADGSGMRILTSGPGNFAFPSWSPDGKRLVALAAVGITKGLITIDVGPVRERSSPRDHSWIIFRHGRRHGI